MQIMKAFVFGVALVCSVVLLANAESPALHGQQRAGESLRYVMDARNVDGGQTTAYRAQADGVVKKNATGVLVDEFRWTQLSFGETAFPLSPASLSLRQELSTDPAFRLSMPNLSKVQAALIGPMLDLLTFYVDVQLVRRQDRLRTVGDHVYVKHGTPNSWADHVRFTLGEDSIDFDITITVRDPQTGALTLVVKHVPPVMPQIHLPADWMWGPVGDTPNNWVQVENTGAGKYVASVGREVFTDKIHLSVDGTIFAAAMENPVEVSERDWSDAALFIAGRRGITEFCGTLSYGERSNLYFRNGLSPSREGSGAVTRSAPITFRIGGD